MSLIFRPFAARHEAAHRRREEVFQRQIAGALDEALQRTAAAESGGVPVLDLDADRTIIFSDQHRGVRNRADDFRRCERAYNAALSYYYALGHTLIVLGDAEELWEERPGAVVSAYAYSLELEARFHQDGRYLRFWGNHDDAWRYPEMVRQHLEPFFPGLTVREGLRLRALRGGRELGHLFLVHGHQGTDSSDRYAAASRLFVRYAWRNFQRLTNFSRNTPARDWRLRERHDAAMYRWAEAQDRLILITGHTHRPVFKSKTHAAQVQEALRAAEVRLLEAPNDPALRQRVADLAAELQWVRAQEQARPGPEGEIEMECPCYFNTGCCSYLDGDVTGLELADGEVRLVRWPDDEERPKPQVLARAHLEEMFAACAAPHPA